MRLTKEYDFSAANNSPKPAQAKLKTIMISRSDLFWDRLQYKGEWYILQADALLIARLKRFKMAKAIVSFQGYEPEDQPRILVAVAKLHRDEI